MDKSFIFAGFGGQGVILAGKLLAQAGLDHGLHVTWLPSYGPEMRGGTANCTVVLADEPIGSPIVDNPTVLVAMNLPSLDRFGQTVAKRGIIIVNSSLVADQTERSGVRTIMLPATDIAMSLGNPQAANMVALGAAIKATDIIPLELMKSVMARALSRKDRSKLISLNERALDAGYNAA